MSDQFKAARFRTRPAALSADSSRPETCARVPSRAPDTGAPNAVRVAISTSLMDVCVVDDDGAAVCPWLTLAVRLDTGAVCGAAVSLRGPVPEAIPACISDGQGIIRQALGLNAGDAVGTLPAGGPVTFVLDHASGSRVACVLLLEAGHVVESEGHPHVPGAVPHRRSAVERICRTLAGAGAPLPASAPGGPSALDEDGLRSLVARFLAAAPARA